MFSYLESLLPQTSWPERRDGVLPQGPPQWGPASLFWGCPLDPASQMDFPGCDSSLYLGLLLLSLLRISKPL